MISVLILAGSDLYEMAVVYADLLEFFVMSSQTCDVSGVESKPKSFANVLPFIPIASYLSREKIAIDIPEENAKDYSKWTTIVEYLENKVSLRSLKHKNDPFELPNVVTEIIREWDPPKKSKERKIRNAIRELLLGFRDPNRVYVYYLPSSDNFGVPEGIVDFCRLYTLPIKTVQDLKQSRIAIISSPYREQFAKKLADYLARIAVLTQLAPSKV